MKGFKTLFISLIVGSAAIIQEENHTPEADYTTPDELNVDLRTAYLECSHYGKEWQLCTSPDGLGTFPYCPAYSEYNESDPLLIEWGEIGEPTLYSPCVTCPENGISCDVYMEEVFAAAGISKDQNSTLVGWINLWENALWNCKMLCEVRNDAGESCNEGMGNRCELGALFCDYKNDDDINGTCMPCPTDVRNCYKDGFASSTMGKDNCLNCQMGCSTIGASKMWVDGVAIPSQPVGNAIQASRQNATGPLHDCSNLSLESGSVCPGADGKMCLVYFENSTVNDDNIIYNAPPHQVSDNAEKSGCVGLIAFDQFYNGPPPHDSSELHIPYVYITEEEGLVLLDSKIGVDAIVEVEIFGVVCDDDGYGNGKCRADLPCNDDSFCAFNIGAIGPDLYSEGWCLPCPKDPTDCYFDPGVFIEFDDYGNWSSPDTVQNVESCAKACDTAAALASKECKFCPTKLTEFSFGVDNDEDKCQFCPQNDVQFPDRIVQLFGDDVTCSQMESFFERLPVPNDSSNCQLAQSMNYICGCEGRGYAGADTKTKKAVLAWLPRIAAILSMLVSLFIIVDTQRTPIKRTKLINKILCTTSVFDVMGSFAMSFTTLPTQEEDYTYGSKGNDGTCKAQGFFIQMGTIACLLGVSLALYYNFVIKHGWRMTWMEKHHFVYYLLAPPIAIGIAFACAGIPFYDNVLVWCNNSAKWWPEIPIVLALFHVTVIMLDVMYSVYKKERAVAQFAGNRFKVSKKVLPQAMLFVGAFYITWIPYLVLQYMLSSGKGYGKYGLALAASTMCALQGFWNFIVYARPREYLTRKSLTSMASGANAFFKGFIKKSINTNEKKEMTHAETTPQNHSEANNQPTSKPVMAISPLFAAESVVVPFIAPDFGEADEHEIGATDDPKSSVTETELVPSGILEVGSATGLAIRKHRHSRSKR